MELVEAILYRKIGDADFNNIEQRKKPESGGGQRYIDAAGIKPELIAEFFKYAKSYRKADAPAKDPRLSYEVNAYALGTDDQQTLEFTPRNNRRNHNITNQTLKDRHIAWRPEKGFPTAPLPVSESIAHSMIANLVVFIIRTNHKNYYAGFINEPTLPKSWPTGVGLERILASRWNVRAKDNGVLFLGDIRIAFTNNNTSPFKLVSAVQEVDYTILPDDIYDTPTDAVEFIDKDITFNIDFGNLSWQETPAPYFIAAPSSKKERKNKGRKRDYAQAQKNRKVIGNIGESIVYEMEKEKLKKLGRSDLANEVEWMSETKGDGLGYDIRSFDIVGGKEGELFIEVKTTTGGETKPFDITENEIQFSEENKDSFVIIRIYGLENDTSSLRYYKLKGSVKDNCLLTPTSYSASPK